jgi:phosphoglycerate dehydrogenase-like enzyme
MSRSPARVLVALPDFTDGISKIRALLPGDAVERIDPYPPGTVLPTRLISERTVLCAEHPPANLAEMERLEWIQLGSAGYQQLSGLPLRTRRVRVTNASGVNDIPIAEWCLLMMLLFERDLPAILRLQTERVWDRRPKFQAELRGRRVGIIGYGSIGREVARLCSAVGLGVWAMNRSPIGPQALHFVPDGAGDPEGRLPERRFGLHEMEAFLPHLDYLVLTAALNSHSRGLLGEQELRLLPPSAVLLNPARAHLVEEAALFRALREGWIAGAAIDSHYREPLPAADPLWGMANVVVTSHIGGSIGSPHYQSRLWALLARNLERYLTDQPLLNEISWSDLDAI